MTNETINQFTKQSEVLFSGFRSYANLAVEHVEKLTNAQLESARAFSEVGLNQARAALEIRDQAGLQAYVEKQQQAAKQVGEQIQGDVQKIAALNEEFAGNAKKLVEGSVKSASKKAKAA